MKKIIVFFCMMVNIIAYGMLGNDVLRNIDISQTALEKMNQTIIPEMYGEILGNNFEVLTESNMDDDDFEHAVGQVWDREKDRFMIESMERINIYNMIPGYQGIYQELSESEHAKIKRMVRTGLAQYVNKRSFIMTVKIFRHAYAVRRANTSQPKTN